MTRILGIDPGSRHTGYGLVEQVGRELRFVACGTITTVSSSSASAVSRSLSSSDTPDADDLPARLGLIFAGLEQVVAEFRPDEVGIEKVFMARNADSALKLGQARGAAIAAVVRAGLPVFEYSARQVKQAVVGRGAAEKSQVAQMVSLILKLDKTPQSDAADALGIAITHAHLRTSLARIAGATAMRGGRAR